MAFAWFLLILAVTIGNLALGFGLACFFGHGPKWATFDPEVESPVFSALVSIPSRLAAIWRTRSASAHDDAGPQ